MTTATREHQKNGTVEEHKQNTQTNRPENNNQQLENTTAVQQTGKQELQNREGVEHTRTGKVYTPAVDIYETSDAVHLVADMPGVDEQSVDVTLEKNVLTIYGRVEPHLPAGHSLTYAEYGVGDYQRSFTISNEINWEGIEGSVKNGVLRLTLPKAGPAQTHKINIKQA